MKVKIQVDRNGIEKEFKNVIGVNFSEIPEMWEIVHEDGKKKFIVQVRISGRTKTLGRFDNIEDAARIADRKYKELYGEFYNSQGNL